MLLQDIFVGALILILFQIRELWHFVSGDVSTINVIDGNGRVTGKIDRAQAIETVRQATPGQTG